MAFAPLLFQAARLLRDGGLLRALDETPGGLSPTEIAARAGVTHYAARVLLEAGLALGLVTSDGEAEGRYRVTRLGLLVEHDPITRANVDFVHDVCYRAGFHLDEALRDGRPAGLSVFGDWPTVYEALAALPERVRTSWLAFDHLYSDSAFDEALDALFARGPLRRLLDVGGNTGRFALRCLERDPDVEVTILDLPGQVAMQPTAARLHAVAFDLRDRARPFPRGFDVVWMSQLVCCFPEEEIVGLLTRARAALAPGGAVAVLETCWDQQESAAARVSLQASSLYFTAVANGTSRMYHSDDLRRCAQAAGLAVVDEVRPLGISHTLFILR